MKSDNRSITESFRNRHKVHNFAENISKLWTSLFPTSISTPLKTCQAFLDRKVNEIVFR